METTTKKKFPGVLWILPIFFGLIGGIISAVIAGAAFKASWWELLFAGIAMNAAWGIVYILLITLA